MASNKAVTVRIRLKTRHTFWPLPCSASCTPIDSEQTLSYPGDASAVRLRAIAGKVAFEHDIRQTLVRKPAAAISLVQLRDDQIRSIRFFCCCIMRSLRHGELIER